MTETKHILILTADAGFGHHRQRSLFLLLAVYRTVRYVAQDMVAISKFLEFITSYSPEIEP